jgi:hypothetical protein
MKYIEFGIGNPSFISTEINEVRFIGCKKPIIIESVYLRVWLCRLVIIIDSIEFLKFQIKPNHNFKILFGIQSK